MEWLNEPANWQRTGDVLTVSVDPSTDFWRETGYGYIRDSGHVYGEVFAGDLDVSVQMRFTLAVQYDQAGVMLRADERTWLKTGVEFFEGRARLSTVLTLGRSSWMVTDLPEGTDEIGLRVSRRGDAVEVRYVIEDGPPQLAALVFMPPGREVLAGVMAAAPEGPGFRVTFHDLHITEQNWSGNQAGWTGDEQPAWNPAEAEPGWVAAEAGEDAPAWPATAEEEPPAWPVPAAADEEPQWQVPAAGDEDRQWPVPTAQEDDPGWRATAGGEEDPDWEPPGDDEAGWVAALAGTDGEDEPAWAAAPAAAQVSDQERAGADDPGLADASEPLGAEPAEAGPAEAGPAGAGPIPATLAGPEPVRSEPADQEHAPDGPPTADVAAAEEPSAKDPPGKNGGGEPWSPAPLAGRPGWARPVTRGAEADVDPATDWDQLAAGAQAGAPASTWHAETDADVASEWPGPPLPTSGRSGLRAGGAAPRPAADQSEAVAQTDPGPPGPLPAAKEPGPPAPPEAGAPGPDEDSATPPASDAAGPDETEPAARTMPDQPEPAQSARQARRARSRRATEAPTEPDAADEWISLLTADPAEE